MKADHEFYIGWQDKMPKAQKTFLRKWLLPLFIFLPILTIAVVWFQKSFNDHQFTLGNVQAFTGTYLEKPVPILKVNPATLPGGTSSDILLVGYGKFGAEGIMEKIEQTTGELHEKQITIRGTLIHGDGKTLLELTEKENALVGVNEQTLSVSGLPSTPTEVNLYGEILDPKCYFGVMKPGEGKSHKSCAIRCISGGIPPVFRTKNSAGFQYYILLGKNGEKINKSLLPFVAEQIEISGDHFRLNGWDVLYVDIEDISFLHT